MNMSSTKSSRHLLATALFTSVLALGACASNPTGGTNFVLMSERSELEKGKELHEELLKEQQIYQDELLVSYVNRVGQKLASVSHRPELQYTFTVIDSPDINAFALPGGYVYIHRGLVAYLTSEAQLAAVLGHEIGHITARHAVRQQTAGRTSNILSTAVSVASVVATGTSVLGETASLFGGALISGYGREMELEADGLGAEYLLRAGYDPNAMVEVIGVLKNHEDFMKKTSNRAPAYHGLFATHPRNDTRLQEAVGKVGGLSNQQLALVDSTEFRTSTTGLVIGPTLQNLTGADARNRYYQSTLNYTMVLPQEWNRDETLTTLTVSAPDNSGSLKVEAQRLQQLIEPRLFLRETMNIPELQQSEALSQFGLPGYTGIRPDTGERVAVVYYGQRAFVFTGTAQNPELEKAILESIRSFRPIARNEGVFANPVQLTWVQADGRTSYAQLARGSRIPEYPEETLRLMNGDYPAGEPQAGEWIKLAN
jgi:predicted Zn-dependent protease